MNACAKCGAALRGSAVRQDGRSASLTAPTGQAQQALLRAALAEAVEREQNLWLAQIALTSYLRRDGVALQGARAAWLYPVSFCPEQSVLSDV